MKRITFIFLITVCGILFHNTSIAQITQSRSAYVSAHLGGFVSSLDGFEKTYGSRIAFALGGGAGFPLSNHMYILGKATYFSKTGIPVWYTYNYNNQTGITTITESQNGTAELSQLIINGGLQYNFFLSDLYRLGISAGVTYTTISEDHRSADGLTSVSISSKGILGFFGGLSIERSFESSPIAIFAEAQSNFARESIFNTIGNYGGINLSLGVRYYFGHGSSN